MSEQLRVALADAIPGIPPQWLRERRWFSSKGRTITSITVCDWGALPLEEIGIIAIAVVRYTTGRDEQYFLPLILNHEPQIAGARPPAALRIEQDGAIWYAHDAFQLGSFQRLLMERLIAGEAITLHGGRIIFRPEDALRHDPPPLEQIKLVTAEQSNTSIIYDRQAILKCFRRVVAGVNPDVEVSRFLTTRAGFRHAPAMLGSMAYISNDGAEHSLGLLQEFAPNRGDAWEYTLDHLAAFLDQVQAADAAPEQIAAETCRLSAKLLQDIYELGKLTGEMHVALASDPDDPDFAPRPLTVDQIKAWQTAIREQERAVLDDLHARLPSLPAEQQSAVTALLDARPRIDRRIGQLDALGDAQIVTTRYHGDYHLGQVLVSARGFLILDFEGEPLRSLQERRAHQSPLKDVAGMLRSLSYAAQTGLRRAQGQPDRLQAWIEAWEAQARDAFLQGYLDATRGAPFVPGQRDLFDTAVAVFELEKAIYELNYELNNRPDWLPIPLEGIRRTI